MRYAKKISSTSSDLATVEAVAVVWETTVHPIMKGRPGAKYFIDYNPGDDENETVIWIWESRRSMRHSTVARYKLRGSIVQQVNTLIRLSKDYNDAVIRIDLTNAGTATADILEEHGVKVEKYCTVHHVGQRK